MTFATQTHYKLDRDSARWNLDLKAVQRRRHLFWEIFSIDMFYSLALGRPPCIGPSYIDCEFPEDDDQTLDENGQVVPGCTYFMAIFCLF